MPVRDAHVRRGLTAVVLLASLLPVAIGGMVGFESMRALTTIGVLPFVIDSTWTPSGSKWLLLQMLAATVLSTAGALLLTAPVALGIGLHLHWAFGAGPVGRNP